MPEPKPALLSVTLTDDGLILQYMTANDVKANGLAQQHTVSVPQGSDYDDELEAVHEALDALLTDVLEDLPKVDVALFPEPDPFLDENGESLWADPPLPMPTEEA